MSGQRRGFSEASAPFQEALPQPVIADACALVFYYSLAGRGMSPRGLAAMRGGVLVSPVTVWELTRKMADGRLPPLHGEDAADLADFLKTRGFEVAPLTWESAALSNALPLHHRDPMDRLLIATALTMGLTILTNDAAFAAYGVPTLW